MFSMNPSMTCLMFSMTPSMNSIMFSMTPSMTSMVDILLKRQKALLSRPSITLTSTRALHYPGMDRIAGNYVLHCLEPQCDAIGRNN